MVLEFEAIDWHKTSPEAHVQRRLNVDSARGLSLRDAEERLKKNGMNKISPLPNPWFWKIMGYLFKGFGSILFVGGILVFISWRPLGDPNPAVANLALRIVLVAVFIIQAAFNAYQDWSSSRVMHSITALLPESCHLIRDGAQTEVSATVIVPGDVRYLQTSHDMTVDRAVLTGECSLCHLLGRWRTFTDHRGLRLGESKPIKSTTESADEITWRLAALASRVHIAFSAAPLALSLRPVTRPSLVRLQSWQANPRRRSQPSRRTSSDLSC